MSSSTPLSMHGIRAAPIGSTRFRELYAHWCGVRDTDVKVGCLRLYQQDLWAVFRVASTMVRVPLRSATLWGRPEEEAFLALGATTDHPTSSDGPPPLVDEGGGLNVSQQANASTVAASTGTGASFSHQLDRRLISTRPKSLHLTAAGFLSLLHRSGLLPDASPIAGDIRQAVNPPPPPSMPLQGHPDALLSMSFSANGAFSGDQSLNTGDGAMAAAAVPSAASPRPLSTSTSDGTDPLSGTLGALSMLSQTAAGAQSLGDVLRMHCREFEEEQERASTAAEAGCATPPPTAVDGSKVATALTVVGALLRHGQALSRRYMTSLHAAHTLIGAVQLSGDGTGGGGPQTNALLSALLSPLSAAMAEELFLFCTRGADVADYDDFVLMIVMLAAYLETDADELKGTAEAVDAFCKKHLLDFVAASAPQSLADVHAYAQAMRSGEPHRAVSLMLRKGPRSGADTEGASHRPLLPQTVLPLSPLHLYDGFDDLLHQYTDVIGLATHAFAVAREFQVANERAGVSIGLGDPRMKVVLEESAKRFVDDMQARRTAKLKAQQALRRGPNASSPTGPSPSSSVAMPPAAQRLLNQAMPVTDITTSVAERLAYANARVPNVPAAALLMLLLHAVHHELPPDEVFPSTRFDLQQPVPTGAPNTDAAGDAHLRAILNGGVAAVPAGSPRTLLELFQTTRPAFTRIVRDAIEAVMGSAAVAKLLGPQRSARRSTSRGLGSSSSSSPRRQARQTFDRTTFLFARRRESIGIATSEDDTEATSEDENQSPRSPRTKLSAKRSRTLDDAIQVAELTLLNTLNVLALVAIRCYGLPSGAYIGHGGRGWGGDPNIGSQGYGGNAALPTPAARLQALFWDLGHWYAATFQRAMSRDAEAAAPQHPLITGFVPNELPLFGPPAAPTVVGTNTIATEGTEDGADSSSPVGSAVRVDAALSQHESWIAVYGKHFPASGVILRFSAAFGDSSRLEERTAISSRVHVGTDGKGPFVVVPVPVWKHDWRQVLVRLRKGICPVDNTPTVESTLDSVDGSPTILSAAQSMANLRNSTADDEHFPTDDSLTVTVCFRRETFLAASTDGFRFFPFATPFQHQPSTTATATAKQRAEAQTAAEAAERPADLLGPPLVFESAAEAIVLGPVHLGRLNVIFHRYREERSRAGVDATLLGLRGWLRLVLDLGLVPSTDLPEVVGFAPASARLLCFPPIRHPFDRYALPCASAERPADQNDGRAERSELVEPLAGLNFAGFLRALVEVLFRGSVPLSVGMRLFLDGRHWEQLLESLDRRAVPPEVAEATIRDVRVLNLRARRAARGMPLQRSIADEVPAPSIQQKGKGKHASKITKASPTSEKPSKGKRRSPEGKHATAGLLPWNTPRVEGLHPLVELRPLCLDEFVGLWDDPCGDGGVEPYPAGRWVRDWNHAALIAAFLASADNGPGDVSPAAIAAESEDPREVALVAAYLSRGAFPEDEESLSPQKKAKATPDNRSPHETGFNKKPPVADASPRVHPTFTSGLVESPSLAGPGRDLGGKKPSQRAPKPSQRGQSVVKIESSPLNTSRPGGPSLDATLMSVASVGLDSSSGSGSDRESSLDTTMQSSQMLRSVASTSAFARTSTTARLRGSFFNPASKGYRPGRQYSTVADVALAVRKRADKQQSHDVKDAISRTRLQTLVRTQREMANEKGRSQRTIARLQAELQELRHTTGAAPADQHARGSGVKNSGASSLGTSQRSPMAGTRPAGGFQTPSFGSVAGSPPPPNAPSRPNMPESISQFGGRGVMHAEKEQLHRLVITELERRRAAMQMQLLEAEQAKDLQRAAVVTQLKDCLLESDRIIAELRGVVKLQAEQAKEHGAVVHAMVAQTAAAQARDSFYRTALEEMVERLRSGEWGPPQGLSRHTSIGSGQSLKAISGIGGGKAGPTALPNKRRSLDGVPTPTPRPTPRARRQPAPQKTPRTDIGAPPAPIGAGSDALLLTEPTAEEMDGIFGRRAPGIGSPEALDAFARRFQAVAIRHDRAFRDIITGVFAAELQDPSAAQRLPPTIAAQVRNRMAQLAVRERLGDDAVCLPVATQTDLPFSGRGSGDLSDGGPISEGVTPRAGYAIKMAVSPRAKGSTPSSGPTTPKPVANSADAIGSPILMLTAPSVDAATETDDVWMAGMSWGGYSTHTHNPTIDANAESLTGSREGSTSTPGSTETGGILLKSSERFSSRRGSEADVIGIGGGPGSPPSAPSSPTSPLALMARRHSLGVGSDIGSPNSQAGTRAPSIADSRRASLLMDGARRRASMGSDIITTGRRRRTSIVSPRGTVSPTAAMPNEERVRQLRALLAEYDLGIVFGTSSSDTTPRSPPSLQSASPLASPKGDAVQAAQDAAAEDEEEVPGAPYGRLPETARCSPPIDDTVAGPAFTAASESSAETLSVPTGSLPTPSGMPLATIGSQLLKSHTAECITVTLAGDEEDDRDGAAAGGGSNGRPFVSPRVLQLRTSSSTGHSAHSESFSELDSDSSDGSDSSGLLSSRNGSFNLEDYIRLYASGQYAILLHPLSQKDTLRTILDLYGPDLTRSDLLRVNFIRDTTQNPRQKHHLQISAPMVSSTSATPRADLPGSASSSRPVPANIDRNGSEAGNPLSSAAGAGQGSGQAFYGGQKGADSSSSNSKATADLLTVGSSSVSHASGGADPDAAINQSLQGIPSRLVKIPVPVGKADHYIRRAEAAIVEQHRRSHTHPLRALAGTSPTGPNAPSLQGLSRLGTSTLLTPESRGLTSGEHSNSMWRYMPVFRAGESLDDAGAVEQYYGSPLWRQASLVSGQESGRTQASVSNFRDLQMPDFMGYHGSISTTSAALTVAGAVESLRALPTPAGPHNGSADGGFYGHDSGNSSTMAQGNTGDGGSTTVASSRRVSFKNSEYSPIGSRHVSMASRSSGQSQRGISPGAAAIDPTLALGSDRRATIGPEDEPRRSVTTLDTEKLLDEVMGMIEREKTARQKEREDRRAAREERRAKRRQAKSDAAATKRASNAASSTIDNTTAASSDTSTTHHTRENSVVSNNSIFASNEPPQPSVAAAAVQAQVQVLQATSGDLRDDLGRLKAFVREMPAVAIGDAMAQFNALLAATVLAVSSAPSQPPASHTGPKRPDFVEKDRSDATLPTGPGITSDNTGPFSATGPVRSAVDDPLTLHMRGLQDEARRRRSSRQEAPHVTTTRRSLVPESPAAVALQNLVAYDASGLHLDRDAASPPAGGTKESTAPRRGPKGENSLVHVAAAVLHPAAEAHEQRERQFLEWLELERRIVVAGQAQLTLTAMHDVLRTAIGRAAAKAPPAPTVAAAVVGPAALNAFNPDAPRQRRTDASTPHSQPSTAPVLPTKQRQLNADTPAKGPRGPLPTLLSSAVLSPEAKAVLKGETTADDPSTVPPHRAGGPSRGVLAPLHRGVALLPRGPAHAAALDAAALRKNTNALAAAIEEGFVQRRPQPSAAVPRQSLSQSPGTRLAPLGGGPPSPPPGAAHKDQARTPDPQYLRRLEQLAAHPADPNHATAGPPVQRPLFHSDGARDGPLRPSLSSAQAEAVMGIAAVELHLLKRAKPT